MPVASPSHADRALVEAAESIAFDPVAFARLVLGHHVWGIPERILRHLAHPRARGAVRACHASSKSYTAAELALWWAWRGGLAVTTAPTWTQVEDVLWSEIHKAYQSARFPLGGELLRTEYRGPTGGIAMGLSTDQGVRFQGFHGKVLLIFDEAVGIRPDIFEAAEGIAAGGDVRMLFLGNPTATGNYFADLWEHPHPGLELFTISAFDTPNLEGLTLADLLALPDHALDDNVRPYLVTRRWVKERYEEWGPDSAMWQSRVLGQFPDQGEDALISRSWILEAASRVVEIKPETPYSAGLDVAGPGDDETVLAIRQGPRVISLQAWHEADTGRLLGALQRVLDPYLPKLGALAVDATGIGYHLAGALAALRPNLRVLPINAGARASEPTRFANLKAELYWSLRERFRSGLIAGSLDPVTQGQLAAIRWHVNLRGLIEIERKDELRRRGVASPDRAEALMLACAADLFAARQQVVSLSFGSGQSRPDPSEQFIRIGG